MVENQSGRWLGVEGTRRSFLKRMAALGFAIPVISTFALESDAFADGGHHHPNQYQPNQYQPNQYQPNQYEPNQYRPNQYQPNQYHPNQYHPNQYHPNQYQPNQLPH